MTKEINVLIQKKDNKSLMWKNSLKKYKINLIPMKGSPIKWIFFFIASIIIHKPEAIIFRYLNDYPSFIRTFLRFLSEALTILLANIISVKIIWICHNIDKETEENFPGFTKKRRKMLQKYSHRILVLDSLLIEEARRVFKKIEIDDISFGQIEKDQINEEEMDEIRNFIRKNKTNNTMFGLTVGTINYKTIHFQEIPRLIHAAKRVDIDLKMIICGPIGNYLKTNDFDTYDFFRNNENILFIDKYVKIDESIIDGLSFSFKSNIDKSVPLSYYTITSANLPLVALEDTFSGKMVHQYNIGLVLKKDYSNVEKILKEIANKNFEFEGFFKNHSWDYAAQKLSKVLR